MTGEERAFELPIGRFREVVVWCFCGFPVSRDRVVCINHPGEDSQRQRSVSQSTHVACQPPLFEVTSSQAVSLAVCLFWKQTPPETSNRCAA